MIIVRLNLPLFHLIESFGLLKVLLVSIVAILIILLWLLIILHHHQFVLLVDAVHILECLSKGYWHPLIQILVMPVLLHDSTRNEFICVG